MLLKIINYPDPRLKKFTSSVMVFDESLIDLCNQMLSCMHLNNGIGLAANQVGLDKRIFVMQNTQKEDLIFINPKILHKSTDCISIKEGCLSFPGINSSPQRFEQVTISYQDTAAQEHTKTLSGLDAICAQHEIDHLNGITFIDHLGSVKKMMLMKKYKK